MTDAVARAVLVDGGRLVPIADPLPEIVRLCLVVSLSFGEPALGPWRVEPVSALVRVLFEAAGPVQGRPRVVAVDGRGGSGKSTLAAQLHAAVPGAVVVHTDDVARHHSSSTGLMFWRATCWSRYAGGGSAVLPAALASQGQAGRDRGTR